MTRATFSRFSQVFSTRPSGMSRARRQETHRVFAASVASRARSWAVPRVPISPWVRSRMPVRCPRCAILSSVPPQVCSTSSRWAARARMSSGGVDMLVEISLLQHDVLAHNQAMRGHLFQRWQHTADMLVGVHENDDYRQLAPGVYEMAGLHLLPAQKSSDRMQRGGRIHVLLPEEVENFHVQGTVMPLVGFVEVDGDLDCHSVWHFTAPLPMPYPLALRPG